MHTTYKKQQGITLIFSIFILGIITFFTLIVFKVSPIYIDHSKVSYALESLKNRTDIENKSKREVWEVLNRQLNINHTYEVTKKDVKITSYPGYLKVQIAYHVKEPVIGNLSLWVDFDDFIEVDTR